MVTCEECNCWLHTKCVGLTPTSASHIPFTCPFCIRSLFNKFNSLHQNLASLTSKIDSLQQTILQSISQHVQDELNSIRKSIKNSPKISTRTHQSLPNLPNQSISRPTAQPPLLFSPPNHPPIFQFPAPDSLLNHTSIFFSHWKSPPRKPP